MSFTMLALGDSLMWGQGLREKDKFYSNVRTKVAAIAKTEVQLRVYAHSGAVIRSAGTGNRFWGEVPVPHPSIGDQLRIARAEVNSADVRLVLVNGGINDIGVFEILTPNPNPWFDKAAWIRARTRAAIWDPAHVSKPMTELLRDICKTFPKAFIVVPGYYQIASGDTNLALLLTLPPIFVITAPLWASVIAQSEAFWKESTNCLLAAVNEANASGEKRVFFAPSGFGPRHALAANEGRLWLAINDPLHQERKDWYDRNPTADPVTPYASMGHPDVEGARMYTSAIMNQVRTLFGPPPSECDQIRASIAATRSHMQQLEETRAGLDPRNPADRREIAEITASIKSLQTEIARLQQRLQVLGCS